MGTIEKEKDAGSFYEWIFEQYPLGLIQDMIVIVGEIESRRLTVGGFVSYAKGRLREIKNALAHAASIANAAMGQMRFLTPRCPECGNPMNLIPVNTGPRDRVGGEWRSMWQCSDLMGCGHEELSEMSYDEEIMDKFGGADPLISMLQAGHPQRRDEDGLRRKMRRAAARLGPRMGPPRRRRCGG